MKNSLFPGRVEQETDEELEFHRQMRLRDLQGRGSRPETVKTELARRMGNCTLAREQMRDARVAPWLDTTLQDLRHGWRSMLREPGVSGLILLVLALGIGGNAAIFTLFKAAFLDPLPYADVHRLVTVLDSFEKLAIRDSNPTIPEFLDVRERNHVFEHMAFFDHRDFQLSGLDEPVRVFAARATASLFPLLKVQAALGRVFTDAENLPGKTNVAVLSHSYWRSHMASDPQAPGKTIRLNGEPYTIVGVLPEDFTLDHPTLGIGETVDVYTPFVMSDYYTLRSGGHSNARRVRVLARLRAGVELTQAEAELQRISGNLATEHPALYRTGDGSPSGFVLRAERLQDAVTGKYRSFVMLLLSVVGLLLLIACGNVAQLLLARSLRREKEVAVRMALGCSRARLIRLFLMESAILALCGGTLGLLLSFWITRGLVALLPVRHLIFATSRPDTMVALFALSLSIASAVLFGIAPAIWGSRSKYEATLNLRRQEGGGAGLRHGMMMLQTAFSVVLLCAAGLLCQNLWKILTAPRGFDPSKVWVMQLRLPYVREQALNPTPMRAYQDYLEKLAAAGLDSATIVSGLPAMGATQTPFSMGGEEPDVAAQSRQSAMWQRVSPGYFQTLRIPLLAGRTFRHDDTMGRPGVAVVNQEFVRRFLPDRNPIGQTIGATDPLTIIGVVGNVRLTSLRTSAEAQVYVSYLQGYDPNVHLLVRSNAGGAELLTRVKQAIRNSYSDQAVFHFMPLEELVRRSIEGPRFQVFAIGAFALLALLMASCGLYGVVSCLVTQRTAEIAIRMALGSSAAGLVRTVLQQTTTWVVVGLGVGIGLGLATSKATQRLSMSAEAGSPLMYAAIGVLYVGVTVLACLAPMRRALRLDPAAALRGD